MVRITGRKGLSGAVLRPISGIHGIDNPPV
jgi:hypothetical protein